MTIQPIALYMLKSLPGGSIGHNNSITFDWSASADDAWTVPLGLTFGRALVRQNGDFWDFSLGVYPLVVRPDAAPSWQLKVGVSYFFE